MKKRKTLFCFVLLSCLVLCNNRYASSADFQLSCSGKENIIEYEKYGTFKKVGENGFHYEITDHKGLAIATGEGVYPYEIISENSLRLAELLKENKLDGGVWEFTGIDDKELSFYKWATAGEENGVKQYFTASVLYEAGLLEQAVKAYYAVLIHFSRSVCWGENGSFVWYVGDAAINQIINICRMHPELKISLQGASFDVLNGNDIDLGNDIIMVDPGRLVRGKKMPFVPKGNVIQQRGQGKVVLKKYENGHWELCVNDRPFVVRAVNYGPTRVGDYHGKKDFFYSSWMWNDSDKNGKVDVAFDTWVDANNNNIQDKGEKNVGDFALLNQMGANAIKIYHSKFKAGYEKGEINKELLREMHSRYGIGVVMGDFFGAYTLGSNADWEKGTDYTDPLQRKSMKASVRKMVLDHKDEPYILMWMLGNENDMGLSYTGVNATRTNAAKYPDAFFSLLEEVVQMIHELDPDHPVCAANLTNAFFHHYREKAPSVDIYGVNTYNSYGFGGLWGKVKRNFDRPVLITEFGSDSYYTGRGERQDLQKVILKNCWDDIIYNTAGEPGVGNSLGGCIFEWLDEWWKDTQSGDRQDHQQTEGQFHMDTFDGWSNEEWFGLVGQGDGSQSPFLRQLKESYYYFADMEKESRQ